MRGPQLAPEGDHHRAEGATEGDDQPRFALNPLAISQTTRLIERQRSSPD